MNCSGEGATHHNACDCREAARAEEVAALRAIAEHGTHTEQTRLLADALGLRDGTWTVDDVARAARERLAAFESCNRARVAAEADVERLIRQRDEARASYQWMVERAADQKLDGYRELGARAAAAENSRDDMAARLAAMKRALRGLLLSRDASWTGGHDWQEAVDQACKALDGGEP